MNSFISLFVALNNTQPSVVINSDVATIIDVMHVSTTEFNKCINHCFSND